MLFRHTAFSNGTSFKNKIIRRHSTVIKNFSFRFNCLFGNCKMPSLARVRDEDVIKSQKGFYIFGKDIREVPCLRSSLLAGIIGGTFAGLISFMTTSKTRLSSHIAFGSLWLIVFAYWIPCRYKYETQKAISMAKYTTGLAEIQMLENEKSSDNSEEEKIK